MLNLNQQNLQLYICIPQLNIPGHPLEGAMLEDHPQALSCRDQELAWPLAKTAIKQLLHRLVRPYFETKQRPLWERRSCLGIWGESLGSIIVSLFCI